MAAGVKHTLRTHQGEERKAHTFTDARDAALPPDRINSSFTPCVSRTRFTVHAVHRVATMEDDGEDVRCA